MRTFTYKAATAGLKGTIIVYLNGRRIGTIGQQTNGAFAWRFQGYRRYGGEHFSTLDACKEAMEFNASTNRA